MTQPSASTPAPHRTALLWLALIAIGIAWGITGPLSKLAVSTGNHPVGVTFWSTAISAVALTAGLLARGRRVTLDRRHLVFFLICGLLGTALPNTLAYTAYRHLSVGVMSITIALVPMVTLLLALPLGIERPDPRRLAGLGLGVVAVLLIVAPEASLPEPGQAIWVALPVIVSLSYATENIYIAAARPAGIDALTILCGLLWGGLILLTPLVVASGAWFDITHLGPPEQAIIANAVLHLGAYFGFIWLIGQAGPVFASQVAYVVTGSGVILGMIVYAERHSVWIWAALALMFAGLALVKPKR
ncbi:MAG: DMT family transporter [Alphaproteobacteria bacterium]